MTSMSWFGHILRVVALSAVLVVGGRSASAQSAPSLDVPSQALTVAVNAAQSQWRGAEAHLSATRRGYDVLAARIAKLKKLPAPSLAEQNELQALLRRSVAAEQDLAVAQEGVRTAKTAVEVAVRAQAIKINAQIKRLVPKLKSGPVAERKKAAKQINALRGLRQEFRQVLVSLKQKAVAPKTWSKYEVAIEPLDGPTDLYEKADFVEDTRDKMRKKRMALARLLTESRQEQEIARAAQDFNTDISLFDEESRTVRVPRQPGSNADVETSAPTRQSDEQADDLAQGPVASPTTPESPPSGTDGRQDADPSTGGQFQGNPNSAPSPTGPADGNPALPTLSRDITPDLLINLRVEELAAAGLDLATLDRLVKELEALDAFLKQQARSIRKHATELEKRESNAHKP